LRANIINLHRLLSLRGKNFRWADLVSGNLKEEKNAHSDPTVAFKWPSASTAQLFLSIRHIADIRRAEPGGSVVYFWGIASTKGNLVRD
jgi:hypothetical protein